MKRLKGTLEAWELIASKGKWRLATKSGYTIANLNKKRNSQQTAQHLAFCWNAFEPDGLVEKLVKKIEKIGVFANHDDNGENIEAIKNIVDNAFDVLAEYKKCNKT